MCRIHIGVLTLFGRHARKHQTTSLIVMANFGGKLEYCGVTKGMCEAIGIKGVLNRCGAVFDHVLLDYILLQPKAPAIGEKLGEAKRVKTRIWSVQDK